VDRRVRDLRRVYQYLVPINRQRLRIAHRRQQNAAARSLLVHFLYRFILPVCVLAQTAVALDNLERSCRAERHAALAVNALRFVAQHNFAVGIVAVYLVGTLSFTDTAGYAAAVIADDFKFGIYEIYAHINI